MKALFIVGIILHGLLEKPTALPAFADIYFQWRSDNVLLDVRLLPEFQAMTGRQELFGSKRNIDLSRTESLREVVSSRPFDREDVDINRSRRYLPRAATESAPVLSLEYQWNSP